MMIAPTNKHLYHY